MPLTIAHDDVLLTAPLTLLRQLSSNDSRIADLVGRTAPIDGCTVAFDVDPIPVADPIVCLQTRTVLMPGGAPVSTLVAAAMDVWADITGEALPDTSTATVQPADFVMVWPCETGAHHWHIERGVGTGHPGGLYATTITFT